MRTVPLLIATVACGLAASGQSGPQNITPVTTRTVLTKDTIMNTMKVEIWSDVVCPFCYIGKRKFEAALEKFAGKDRVEVEWKSFELQPGIATDTSRSVVDMLAAKYGMSTAQAQATQDRVTATAKDVGLDYHLDRTFPTNTLNAHRMIHFAKAQGKQYAAKEALLYAYFTEGKNVDDQATLLAIGATIGLDTAALRTALEDGSYADDVRHDILEAQQLGVRGVPFFVFDRKYAVSGAQDTQVFTSTLDKAFGEWASNNPVVKLETTEGPVCTPQGECK